MNPDDDEEDIEEVEEAEEEEDLTELISVFALPSMSGENTRASSGLQTNRRDSREGGRAASKTDEGIREVTE